MSARFFGQFLLEKGVVSQRDLIRAVELQAGVNKKFGDTALSLGLVTDSDIERIQNVQIRENRPFGDVAISLGIMTADDVNKVLEHQKRKHLHIGDALVRVGAVAGDDLRHYLDMFELEQTRYMMDGGDVPSDIAHRNVWKAAAHLTYTLFQRVLKVPLRAGPCQLVHVLDGNDLVVGMKLRGPGVDARFLLSVSSGVRQHISQALLRTEDVSGEPEAVLNDSIREFLNMICGTIATKASQMGLELEISAPFTVDQTEDGVEIPEDWQGLRFPVHFAAPRDRAEFAICV